MGLVNLDVFDCYANEVVGELISLANVNFSSKIISDYLGFGV